MPPGRRAHDRGRAIDATVETAATDAPSGELLALNAATGALRWRLPIEGGGWSSPVAADRVIYVGTESGNVLAISEANASIPRLAVFYDSTIADAPWTGGGRLEFEYFRDLGYDTLSGASLATFLAGRIADGVPSAVVFATDILPRTVAPTMSDTVLVRRYLDSGGKIVWPGAPIGIVARDSAGNVTAFDPSRMEQILDVSAATMDYDPFAARPTAAGLRWGIDRWVRGSYPISPSAVGEVLATDENGNATAWVQPFHHGRPGSGYVQLWGIGADVTRLPMIRAVTEYGLLRKASEP